MLQVEGYLKALKAIDAAIRSCECQQGARRGEWSVPDELTHTCNFLEEARDELASTIRERVSFPTMVRYARYESDDTDTALGLL